MGEDVKYMSERIGDAYKTWGCENIMLNGGTGCGKTTFCIDILGEYAKNNNKKIVFLSNRRLLKDEVIERIKSKGLENTFEVITYQKLQDKIVKGEKLPDGDYLIADECHYFTTDSYNRYTDLSFNYLKKAVEHSTVIYMSATALPLFKHLCTKRLEMGQPFKLYSTFDNYHYVKQLFFYEPDNLAEIIDSIIAKETTSKIAVFLNSKDKIMKMHKKYKDDACYYCSEYTDDKDLRDICSHDAIKGYSFEKRILFTTSAADNGISFKDKKIKHIFTELMDPDSLVQSLGRKRCTGSNDKCTFYISEYSKKGFNIASKACNERYKIAKEYLDNEDAFIETHIRDRLFYSKYDIFYQGIRADGDKDIMLNKLMYTKCVLDREFYEQVYKDGYKLAILDRLGDEMKYKAEPYGRRKSVIKEIKAQLSHYENIPLFDPEKDQIKSILQSIGFKFRSKHGITEFNKALNEIDGYTPRFINKPKTTDEKCKEFRDYDETLPDGSENPNYKQRYWVLTDPIE